MIRVQCYGRLISARGKEEKKTRRTQQRVQDLHAGQRLRPLAKLADGRVHEQRAARDVGADDAAEHREPEGGGHGIVEDQVAVLDRRGFPGGFCCVGHLGL